MRSLMPVGETVTSVKFVSSERVVVMHTARTVANIDEDMACRTKVAAAVANAGKLLAEYQFGWHRVTVYGEQRARVRTLATLVGFKVVEEG